MVIGVELLAIMLHSKNLLQINRLAVLGSQRWMFRHSCAPAHQFHSPKSRSTIRADRRSKEALGNVPRRFFYGPGINNFDLTLIKRLKVTESKSFGCDYFATTAHRPAGWSRSWSFLMWKGQY
jgi:hypothetical protein